MQDRLEHIRKKLKSCKVYYSHYRPSSEMMYEVEDAGDDLLWMIHEIERLRGSTGNDGEPREQGAGPMREGV